MKVTDWRKAQILKNNYHLFMRRHNNAINDSNDSYSRECLEAAKDAACEYLEETGYDVLSADGLKLLAAHNAN